MHVCICLFSFVNAIKLFVAKILDISEGWVNTS